MNELQILTANITRAMKRKLTSADVIADMKTGGPDILRVFIRDTVGAYSGVANVGAVHL